MFPTRSSKFGESCVDCEESRMGHAKSPVLLSLVRHWHHPGGKGPFRRRLDLLVSFA